MTDKLKLLPREATREMLEAMDECSMEGYDERLYAGHAGSVYMAAWDAFHGQHCYCGDITNLGVIHRDDGPCHYPEHTSEYKRGYADAMNWKVQNHLEHLQPKVRTGDCLLTGVCASEGHKIQPKEPEQEPVAWMHTKIEGVAVPHRPADLDKHPDRWEALYKTPSPCPTCEALARTVMLDQTSYDTTPPQRTWVGLTVEEINEVLGGDIHDEPNGLLEFVRAIEAKLRSKNT